MRSVSASASLVLYSVVWWYCRVAAWPVARAQGRQGAEIGTGKVLDQSRGKHVSSPPVFHRKCAYAAAWCEFPGSAAMASWYVSSAAARSLRAFHRNVAYRPIASASAGSARTACLKKCSALHNHTRARVGRSAAGLFINCAVRAIV
jgi:hypothetical protein